MMRWNERGGVPVVVSIGESLFDCFLDRAILGGAPVNVAVHIQQLLNGVGQAILVSRVGNDELGEQLIEEVARRDMPTNLIQRDAIYPTGKVDVDISPSGEPHYDICDDVAWDYIAFEDSLELLAASCSAVCFGTLAQRGSTSRATIQRFVGSAHHAIRFLDVNLRQHYATAEIVEQSLSLANVVKLNESELQQMAHMLPRRLNASLSGDRLAQELLREFDLDLLAVTRGSRGTLLFTTDDRLEGETVSVNRSTNADDVGAGDACSAGLVFGLLMDWPRERILSLANQMGAFVASQRGGTPRLPRHLIELTHAQQV